MLLRHVDLVTSVKEAVFSPLSMCLLICLFVSKITKIQIGFA